MREGGAAERRLAALLAGCALALAVAAAVAGHAADQVISSEADSAEVISALGVVPAEAGRIEALAAELGDPTLNPASVSGIRSELANSAARLTQVGVGVWAASSPAPGAGRSASPDPVLDGGASRVVGAAVRAAGVDLGTAIRSYADAGRRAALPGARLGLGELLRGDIDGEYPTLIAHTEAVNRQVRSAAVTSSTGWSSLVQYAVIGLVVAGVGLVGLVLGPVGAVIRRNRAREERAERERRDAAAYVEQLLDGIDVPVLASDAAGGRLVVNPAGRAFFRLPVDGPLDWASLSQAGHFQVPGQDTPVPQESMPPQVARLGRDVPQTELVFVPAAPPRDPAGRRRVVVCARPLRSVDGSVVGAVTTFQDVTELHRRNEDLATHAAQLAAISEASRAILRESDARGAVCSAAESVSGAVLVCLFEDDGHHDLVCTAAVGVDTFGMRLPQDAGSVTAEVFASGRARTLIRLADHPEVDNEMVRRLSTLAERRITGAAWIPVMAAGRCLGVLTLAFDGDVDPAGHVPVLEVLAAETAVALERQNLLRRLSTEADTDGLTGAANRRAWETLLPQGIDLARRRGEQVSVLMLDIDHFKAFNDRHGHPAGDALLREAVTAWRAWLRPRDVLARYGGEEFAVLLPGCTPAQAVAVADALRSLMPDAQTCSAGVATWDGLEEPGHLMARADAALYRAKNAGRDRTAGAEDAAALPRQHGVPDAR